MRFDSSSALTEQERSGRFEVKRLGWFFLALAILSAWHIYHGARGTHWSRPPLPHGDGPDYESLAYSLSRGEGFQFAWRTEAWQKPYREDRDAQSYAQLSRIDWPGPTASRPPLYPMAIAGIYSVVPRGPRAFAAVRVFSILCTAMAGALAVWIAFDLTSDLRVSRWVPILAAVATLGLALLDRTIRTYSVDFLTEPMAMLLSMSIALSLMRWQQGHQASRFWFTLLVLATSALILTRSITIFWLPGLAILVAASTRFNRLRWTCWFIVLVVLMLAPWWTRNCVVLQRIMPLGGQGAASLRGGYCDESLADRGNWHGEAEERLQRQLDGEPGCEGWTQAQREVALAHRASRETWDWIAANRMQLPSLMAMRVESHWSPFTGTSLLWRIAILMGWLGLALSRRRELIALLGLPVISTCTVAILYETGGRFLVPLYALLYLTAGIGVALAIEGIARRMFALRRPYRS
jgi:hypothetical protein